MTIRAAYPSYKEIRFEIITPGKDSEPAEPGSRIPGSQNDPAASATLGLNSRKESFNA